MDYSFNDTVRYCTEVTRGSCCMRLYWLHRFKNGGNYEKQQ